MWERIGECVREMKLGTTHTRCVPLSQSAATAVRGHEEQGPVASAQPGREQVVPKWWLRQPWQLSQGSLEDARAQPILRGRQRRAGGNCADASRWLRHYVRLRSTIGRNLKFRATGALEVQGGAFAYASIEVPSLFGNLHFLPRRPGTSAVRVRGTCPPMQAFTYGYLALQIRSTPLLLLACVRAVTEV